MHSKHKDQPEHPEQEKDSAGHNHQEPQSSIREKREGDKR